MDRVWPAWGEEADMGIPLLFIEGMASRQRESGKKIRADKCAEQGCDLKWNSMNLIL